MKRKEKITFENIVEYSTRFWWPIAFFGGLLLMYLAIQSL